MCRSIFKSRSTPGKTEQLLQGTELPEKEEDEDEKHIGKVVGLN